MFPALVPGLSPGFGRSPVTCGTASGPGLYLTVMHSDNLSAGQRGPMEVTGSCGSPC